MAEAFDSGPARLDIWFTQGDGFEMTVDVEGDRSADDFEASMVNEADLVTTDFTIVVGSYSSGTDSTAVTLSLTGTQTAALATSKSYWDLEWTASGGEPRTLIGESALKGRSEVRVLSDITNG